MYLRVTMINNYFRVPGGEPEFFDDRDIASIDRAWAEVLRRSCESDRRRPVRVLRLPTVVGTWTRTGVLEIGVDERRHGWPGVRVAREGAWPIGDAQA